MIQRLDTLPQSNINPFTGQKYDDSWRIFKLTNSVAYSVFSEMSTENVHITYLSQFSIPNWQLAVGDFIGYSNANNINGILVMSKSHYEDSINKYIGHSYNEPMLRMDESPVLIHSTTSDNWKKIQKDGMLKSWNRLKQEILEWESQPIGAKLGDPKEYCNYIMFGTGITGEIVVSSKLSGSINMDANTKYHTGARLYFNAKLMARDGLLIRDGEHIKVKDTLPLEPYLIWAATWKNLRLESPISTPKIFAQTADNQFHTLTKKD